MTPADANSCTGIIYIISLVASPIIGLSIDFTGRNILWVMVSVLMTVGCHALMAFSFVNPWVAMVSEPNWLAAYRLAKVGDHLE